jgi:hypothetical protein
MSSVHTSVSSGFSVYIAASQLLQNGSAQLFANVSDGAVTVGSEEYGASVTGTTAFGSGVDTAVTTTQRVIQSKASASGSVPDRIAMIYKVALSSTTNGGTYSHSVYYTLTANY